jgi:phospholipase/carboxylesterase
VALVGVATRLGPLEARVVQEDTSARPELAVVLCHGFGASGADLVPLAGELLARAPSLAGKVRFVFPAAPLALPSFGLGEARAWWPIDFEAAVALRAAGPAGSAQARARVPDGLASARRQLAACVEAVGQTSGVPMGRIVLGGFSQGAMVCTDLTLRQDEAPAALAIFSGTLICEAEWKARAVRRKGLRVLQSHGRTDPLLSFSDAEALRDLLRAAGLDVEFLPFDGPHSIPEEALDRLGALLVWLLERRP